MAHVIQLGFVHKRSGIVSFENNYVMLSKEQAQHINERHVDVDKDHRASKFLPGFNPTSTLAFLTRKTFQDIHDYHIIEEGYKRSHGRDLHLLFLEEGIWREIQDYFSPSIFNCLILIPEAQKERSGASLVVSTNGSFRSHQIYESQ